MAVVIIDSSRSKYSGICMHALGQIACVDLSVCHCKVAYLCKKKRICKFRITRRIPTPGAVSSDSEADIHRKH
jgi:hypothetical protein